MTQTVERMLWLGVAIAATVAVLEARASTRSHAAAAFQPWGSAPALQRVDEGDLEKGAEFSIDNDPFRLARQPATVRYSSAPAAPLPPVAAAAPRPTLILRGIVGGPPWSAILEGVPGREGTTMLRPGDSAGVLVVRSVGRDTVIIKGADTTWRLTVKRTW